jgi:hemolysin activation/secretion protein
MDFKKVCGIFLASIFLLFARLAPTCAAPGDFFEQQEQREAQRRAAQESQRMAQEDMARLGKAGKKLIKIDLPEETPAFFIRELKLVGPDAERFRWAQKYLNKYKNQNIGMRAINILAKILNEALLSKGFITSRIYINQQDISGGVLQFDVVAGKVKEIGFADPKTGGRWENAFPLLPGDVLNVRDLEQGLDQMRRVPSQDVDVDIQPAAGNPGMSDITIKMKRTKPWRVNFTFDDSGTKDTGKNQFTGAFCLDNLLSMNDILYLSYNEDAAARSEIKGTRANSFYYSFPIGKDTVSLSYYYNSYRQSVKTYALPLKYSGKSAQAQLSWSRLLYRNQKEKASIEFDLIKKQRHAYIDGSEITVQRQKTVAARLGLTHRQYLGQSVLDWAVRWQWGTGLLGARPGPSDHLPNNPTTRYGLLLVDVNLNAPLFIPPKITGRYSVNIRVQRTRDFLYASEFFSLGGRYTVRGFDGEQTLAAESGFLIRQEISFPVIKKQHQLYLAFDAGKITGPSSGYYPGRQISGLAAGLRGKIKHISYDAFAGWPLRKPEGFKTAKQTFGFMTSAQF